MKIIPYITTIILFVFLVPAVYALSILCGDIDSGTLILKEKWHQWTKECKW